MPDWLAEPGDPWVLVTMSTDYQGDYQGDERLAEVAVEALRDEPVRVLVTLGAGVSLPAKRLTPDRLRTALHAAMAGRAGSAEASRRLRAFAAASAVPSGGFDSAGDVEGVDGFDPARGPAGLGGARFAAAAQELAPLAAADRTLR
ncbi:hypothetical protein [Frankia tisae]|uniref:hypothetical protein n=1 Tax=Frankia tisae TaxID=2950104 RepID=UPI0021C07405|nr:hypothetical protein [Frankia tisae]